MKKISVIIAMTMVFMLVFSSTASAAVISNTLEATFNVTDAGQGDTPLDAVNAADDAAAMQTALENEELGLDLAYYNQLTEGGRRQAVASFVLFVKGIYGDYQDVDAVQTAFDAGVEGETHKMQLIRLADSANANEAVSELTDIVTDLKTDSESFTTEFTKEQIDGFYGEGLYDSSLAAIELYEQYLGFNDYKKLAVAANFIANEYNGSFVTVMGYLKNAIDFVSADNTPVTVTNARRIYGDLWGSVSARSYKYVDVEVKFGENFHYTTGDLKVSYWTKDDSGEYVEIKGEFEGEDVTVRKDSTWNGAWTKIPSGEKVSNEQGGYQFTEFVAGEIYGTTVNGSAGWASNTKYDSWWDALWDAAESGKGVWVKIEVIDDAGNYSEVYAPIAEVTVQEPEEKLVLTWDPADFDGVVDVNVGDEATIGVTAALAEGVSSVEKVRFEIEVAKEDANGGWIAAGAGDFEITKVNGSDNTQGINNTFQEEGGVLKGYWGPVGGFTFTEETTTTMTVRFDTAGTYKVRIYAIQVE